MVSLSYRGSDNGEITGKPKVFFAAHPSELPYYLEQVISWLHACRDCVIWYAAAASDDGEESAVELKMSEIPGILDTSWLRTYISRDMLVQKNEDPYPQYVEWMEEPS